MFLSRLESLRGIAAFMVAVAHCFIVLSVEQNQAIWDVALEDINGWKTFVVRMLLVLFNGGAAVTIFFVLSGYVLGISLDNKSKDLFTVIKFYIKRVFRIYPAYLACLAIILFSIHFFHEYIKFPNTSLWFNWWYTEKFQLKNVLENIALIDTNLNPIAWTLRVELLMSMFFPFAYLASRNVGTRLNLVFLLLLIGVSYFFPGYEIALYGFVFYLGLILPSLSLLFKKYLRINTRGLLFVVSCLGLLFSRLILSYNNMFYVVLMEGVAATFIIDTIINSKRDFVFNRLLDIEIIQKLGRYSYSFYLYHFIILYWVSYGVLNMLPAHITLAYPILVEAFLAILSIIMAYYVAILSYRGVERPMISLGAAASEYCCQVLNTTSVRFNELFSPCKKVCASLLLKGIFKR